MSSKLVKARRVTYKQLQDQYAALQRTNVGLVSQINGLRSQFNATVRLNERLMRDNRLACAALLAIKSVIDGAVKSAEPV